VILNAPQEAALRRVLRAARELETAENALADLLSFGEDDPELAAFMHCEPHRSFRVIDGGMSASA
jgi:hypothetical protein